MRQNKLKKGANENSLQDSKLDISQLLEGVRSKLRAVIAAHGRQWLFLLMGAVVVPTLFLLLLETGLRVAGYGYPSTFFVEAARPNGQGALTTNQHFGQRFFPSAIARTPEPCYLPLSKPPGTYRIFVLGGSAAMGVPEPAFSFGRILEIMLRERYPKVRFEVINAAMTAINSHVVLPIARDCARHEPDLFVIYMGNNEFVGPYGPASVFHRSFSGLGFIRFGIWLNSTKVGQLLGQSLLPSRKGELTEWKGMAMFLDRQVSADDPRLERTYLNFRENLREICHVGLRNGAGLLVSTVPTNLKDNAPFASLHRTGMSAGDVAEWDAFYKAGIESQARGELDKALKQFHEAERLDGRYADLQFHLARCYLALNDPAEAKKRFTVARDLDALRFRADTQINRIVREVASGLSSQGVELVDAEQIFEQSDRTAQGILGEEMFYEHVHLNFDGNYLLASAMLGKIESILPSWVRQDAPEFLAQPVKDQVAEQLSLTGWDRYRMLAGIYAMMERPPFTNQFGDRLKKAYRTEQVRTLKALYATPAALQEAQASYQAALGRSPDDLYFRQRFAELLAESGDFTGAAEQWRWLLDRLPGSKSWRIALASTLSDAGKPDESIEQYHEVLAVDPQLALAHFGIGSVLQKQGRLEEAAGSYQKALRINPNYAEAENNLGMVFMARGNVGQALRHYSLAIEMKPDFAQAYNNKGLALLSQKRLDEAVDDFSEAVKLKPEFAESRYNLGSILATQGQTREAIAEYAAALRARPNYPEAHYGMGGALAVLGEIDEAIAHYTEAVRDKPEFAEAHYDLGLLLSRQGKLEQAVSSYSEALRLKPDYPEALNNMGTALARQRKFEEAMTYFSKALEVRPDFADARENLERAQKAQAQRKSRSRP